MTDPLRQAKAELNSASRAIEAMRSSESMEHFEAEWRSFLTCIEKVWTKTERCCDPQRNLFQPWQGRYLRLRKKDMLLRYLKQARDTDNHSIQEMTAINPARRTIAFANPLGGHVEKITFSGNGDISYTGDPIVVTATAPHPVAVPVKNNGQWYNPPTSHLDTRVASAHPIELAELGLAFYESFVRSVEEKFF